MKYGSVSLGQVEAAINKLGGKEVWDAWLRGEKIVVVEDAIQALFDKHGRRIPNNLHANVCDANRNYYLNQSKLKKDADYAKRIMRLYEYLYHLDMRMEIIVERLKTETERLLTLIRGNPKVANIINGVWLPVVLPRLTTGDVGSILEYFLKGVEKSYAKTFSDRKFISCHKGELAGVNIIGGSRWGQLIERIKHSSVIGIHFPNSLQGFSINASREQMSTLPEGFILSGVDTLIAMMMYPDILARDQSTPNLNLSAFSRCLSSQSFQFRTDATCLSFIAMGDEVSLSYHSSGLLFIG